ncbi:tubulin-tyrosine ligase [Pseudoscourfieldia marina]
MPTSSTSPLAQRYNRMKTSKTFLMIGNYPDLKDALVRRGWVEVHASDDSASAAELRFDLKWTTKARDIDHKTLAPHQIVNHFQNSYKALTTKVGLGNSIRGAMNWVDNFSEDAVFPRSYDLSERHEYAAFVADFIWGAAEGVLKRTIEDGGLTQDGVPTLNVVKTALLVVEQKVRYTRHLRDDEHLEDVNQKSGAEDDDDDDDANCRMLPAGLREAELSALYNCAHFTRRPQRAAKGAAASRKRGGSTPRQSHITYSTESSSSAEVTCCTPLDAQLMQRVERGLSLVSDPKYWPQASTDGKLNVWIIKPAGKSRGRGIRLFNNLDALRSHLAHGSYRHDDDKENDDDGGGDDKTQREKAASARGYGAPNPEGGVEQWVAQRYIERPLTVHGRKFDIRQWVLVTEWEPLTIWMHQECYIRLCAEDYDARDIENRFRHLSNNSIAKYSKEHKKNYIGSHNMLTRKEFSDYLAENVEGADEETFDIKMYPKIMRTIIATIRCAQGTVEPRANSFELYGYDFTVDDNLNTWLLEVNSSPSLEHSTEVTSSAVKNMCEDLCKVIVDLPQTIGKRHSRRGKHALFTESDGVAATQKEGSGGGGGGGGDTFTPLQTAVDTGAWQCVFRADMSSTRMAGWISTELMVTGDAIDYKTPEIVIQQQAQMREYREAERQRHHQKLREIAEKVREERLAKVEAERSEQSKLHRRRRRTMLELAAKSVARLEVKETPTEPVVEEDAAPALSSSPTELFPPQRRRLRPISARKHSKETMERIRAHAERQRMSRMLPPWIRRMQALEETKITNKVDGDAKSDDDDYANETRQNSTSTASLERKIGLSRFNFGASHVAYSLPSIRLTTDEMPLGLDLGSSTIPSFRAPPGSYAASVAESMINRLTPTPPFEESGTEFNLTTAFTTRFVPLNSRPKALLRLRPRP